MSVKKQLLDPLGTMCKLVGLNFAKLNTKISIHDHVLTLDEPADTQFILRWINNDGKENISELYYVIIRIIRWYIIDQYNNDNNNVSSDKDTINENEYEELVYQKQLTDLNSNSSNTIKIGNSDELRKMLKYLCFSFEKLQKTYEFGNVILSLQFLINLINDALDGNFNENRLPSYILEKEKEYSNLLDYNKMKSVWRLKTLITITELYDNCFRVCEDTDMHEKTKEALIHGYLSSVNATLTITDNEFKILVSNSKKG
jgi:hypothetical protein